VKGKDEMERYIVDQDQAMTMAAMEDCGRELCRRFGISWESCAERTWAGSARWALVLAAKEVDGNPNVIYSYGRDMMYRHAARHMVSSYLNETY
jgi:hypothetical protein